jgi:hypothetical protein
MMHPFVQTKAHKFIQRMTRSFFFAAAIVPSLSFAVHATPVESGSETGVEICRQRIETELPGSAIELNSGLDLLNGFILLNWRTDRGVAGFCRVTAEGQIVEFVNPYALPRGQRPIESLAAFETNDYTVRVLQLGEQTYLTVYDRTTSKIELDRALAQAIVSDEGVVYTNLLGRRTYQAIVTSAGEYRLLIQSGGRITYDAEGGSLSSQEATQFR